MPAGYSMVTRLLQTRGLIYEVTRGTVDSAEYVGRTDYRWDDSLPGFGLRILISDS